MMHRATKLFLIAITAIMGLHLLLLPAVGHAQYFDESVQDACEGITGGGSCTEDSKKSVNGVIKTVIDVFSLIVGVASVIMIMVGGFKYITSTGDSASTASAKNTILYAIVGLVIVLSAQLIVAFVLSKL